MQKESMADITPERIVLELAGIGFGTKKFPEYDKAGAAVQVYPPITARLKALELIYKHISAQESIEDNGILPEVLELLKG